MYQPTLGRFLSRDPLSPNGVDVLTDTGFYGDRLAAMRADPWYYGGNWEHPYVYVKSNPTNYVDPSGMAGHIVGGVLIGCGASAGYSLVHSLLTGDSFCKTCCKIGVSCLFGAVGGAIAAALPNYSGCIIGFVSGITESSTKQFCNHLCGDSKNANLTCAVATAVITGAAGCALNKRLAVGEKTPERERIAKFLWQIVSRIIGYDVYNACNLGEPEALPLPAREVCCTLKGRVWGTTSYTIDCTVGRTAFGCCRDKAASSAWWGEREIVSAREGPC